LVGCATPRGMADSVRKIALDRLATRFCTPYTL